MVKVIDQAYKLTQEFYGDRCAKRSGVPLINHINEGVTVLNCLGASDEAIAAYILHPIFQNDKELEFYQVYFSILNPRVVGYVMEYRNIANASLSSIVDYDYSCDTGGWSLTLTHKIKTSPIGSVNLMLIADKVQNYKDFITYHKDTHHRSAELDFYFRQWLKELRVSISTFNHLCSVIDAEKSS